MTTLRGQNELAASGQQKRYAHQKYSYQNSHFSNNISNNNYYKTTYFFSITLDVVFLAKNSFHCTLCYILEYNDVFNALTHIPKRRPLNSLQKFTMKCIHCEHEDTRVIETREAGLDVRRRRECAECGQRFTTYERYERQPIRIVKKDGSRELYNRDKLKRGIVLACEKRPVTEDQIIEALNEIERMLRAADETEVPTKVLGELCMDQLKKLDKVAYIRFASVYKEFRSVKSFEKEIKVLTGGTK